MTSMRLFTKTIVLLLSLLVLSGQTFAQPQAWMDSVSRTAVFELSSKETVKLLEGKFKQKHWDKIRQNPIACFSETWAERPEKGHFIFAKAEGNSVCYDYVSVIPFQVLLFKEYGVLALQVIDSEGTIRKDAKVLVGKRALLYDKETQTYRKDIRSQTSEYLLTVELDKFRAVFDLRKHPVLFCYKNRFQKHVPKFYSYLVTDKHTYKPGETVRFKSYALSNDRKPLKQKLSLWINKEVLTVTPYRPGGFAGEFQLADSLNLKLDNQYAIQLRDPSGRIVASTPFKYEDYDLYDNELIAKLDSDVQYSPQENQIKISATDVNGLPLRETNVKVTVSRQQVMKSYTEVLSLPDTLMAVQVKLDASGKAAVDIPAKLFGASDCRYYVNVILLTSDNQRLEQSCQAVFYHSSHALNHSTQADSLCFSFLEQGKERAVDAELVYDGQKKVNKIRLPYREPFNQSISGYWLRIPEIDYQTYITSRDLDTKLRLEGGIRNDSLCVILLNPLKLELSWYVYRRDQLLKKGSGKEMEYKMAGVDHSSVYYVELFYYIGNETYAIKRSFSFPAEQLQIKSDLPERISPGQKVKTTLNVSDAKGQPVADVDITAFAVNSQLGNYAPDLRYYGNTPLPREQQANYSSSKKKYSSIKALDYAYWKRLLNLDQLPYYQFIYPEGKLFRRTVNTPDGTTQFSPYIMHKGEAVKIYVIEQNGIPCYFSWTEQPQEYAFRVSHPQKKQKITLRIHDRAFIMDSIAFQPGQKTILSFDLEQLPENIKVIPLDQKQNGKFVFTPQEKTRYQSYLCRLPVAAEACTYLKGERDTFPVSIRALSKKKEVLAGPIEPGLWQYMNETKYRHTGGFSYEFEGNTVYKYPDTNLLPTYLSYSSTNRITTLDDFNLTPERFRNLVDKLNSNIWFPSHIYLSLRDKELCFRLPVEKDSSGVANLLFRDCKSGKLIHPVLLNQDIRTYSNRQAGTYNLPAGIYDVILLYNNGKYLKKDSLSINSYAYLEVNMEHLPLRVPDTFSSQWLLLENYDISNMEKVSRTWVIKRPVRKPFGIAHKVYGYVTDASGESLPGCAILVKGTTVGTITDIDGYFELDFVAPNDTLQFSYIGMKSKKIPVWRGTELIVTMEEDNWLLEEVVVTSYGTSYKKSISASSSRSSSPAPGEIPLEELEKKGDDSIPDDRQLYHELVQLQGLRKNFSDVGFWQPRLFTDKEGKAQFEVTFPDNITRWDAMVYGMNERLQTGTYRHSVRSYKPLMAELKTPAFLITGDQSDLVGTIRNYMEGQQIVGKTLFTVGTDTLERHEVSLTEGFHETLPLLATATDSVTARYLLTRNDGYTDGEERTIPVLPQGAELAQGILGILAKDTLIHIKAGKDEEISVSIADNPRYIYTESAKYLIGYQYLCNEQLASKLIGLISSRQFMQYQGESSKALDKAVKKIIGQLINNQNKQKLWSWWGNSENTSYWMSAHIWRALKMAKDADFPVELDLKEIKVDYVDTRPYHGEAKLEDIEILHALFNWDVEGDYAPAVKLLESLLCKQEQAEAKLARTNTSYIPNSYLKEKLLLWEMRQRIDSVNLTDSVRHYLKKDILGGVYCGDYGLESNNWENHKLMNTLIAYRIMKNDPSSVALRKAMQLYILRTKTRGWNTYQSASAVATILTDLLDAPSGQPGMKVFVSGKENKEIKNFPYDMRLKAGENITISKTGPEPILYSTYAMKRTMDAKEGEAFKIESHLGTDTLTAGVPVTLTVTLQVKQQGAQYVMLEVPIPAGCSYDTKPNSLKNEAHREYFKEKTAIFIEDLPIGTHTFQISLLPRFTGKYTLNPAKVELMYFPAVNANNAAESIRIIKEKDK